jgi:DNA-binding protein HU-beta
MLPREEGRNDRQSFSALPSALPAQAGHGPLINYGWRAGESLAGGGSDEYQAGEIALRLKKIKFFSKTPCKQKLYGYSIPETPYFKRRRVVMTKAELVEAVAKSANLTKAAAEKAVGAFISTVSGALKKGDRVTLVGFGSFEVASRKARTGRNPQTGKEIKIAAAKVPKFRPGKALKDAVAKKK